MNAGFAYWLWTRAPGWTDIFEAASIYALIDGALALVMSVLLARHLPRGGSQFLLSITIADAVLLLAAGAAIHVFPGIPGFPVTIVLFYAAVGVWAGSLGAVAIVMSVAAIERDRHAEPARRLRDHELFDPIAGAGLIAFVFALYAFLVGPPTNSRSLLHVSEAGSGLLAAVFLAGSIGLLLRRN